jgi:hypothetical protein
MTSEAKIVLIRTSLEDVNGLSAAAVEDARVILYDAHQDNLAAIVEKLDGVVEAMGQKIDHLAVLSHGDPGVLKSGMMISA